MSLPKGGGAIRGLGEKFAANPATGTASLTVPLPVSPGRAGFGPQLSLSYDSGAGNGPFGFGWTLGIPSISRKTEKGLPQYRDAEESDVFILSGAEDLVPLLEADGERHEDDTTAAGFRIHRYRPRIEGAFARIERWTDLASGHAQWRSISRDNITTIYGRDGGSCIFDPADPARVFTWLICESHDDKGNALVYDYVSEDAASVDLTQANERNRLRTANKYVKRVRYGNRVSRLIEPDLTGAEWLFELVFDYDEGHYEPLPLDANLSEDAQHRFVRASASPAHPWSVRPDAFSSYRSGFEVRAYRLCRRVMMFHRFDEFGDEPCLVRAVAFDYTDLDFSFIRAVTSTGYLRDEMQPVVEAGGARYVTYLEKSLPPLELEYSSATIQDEVRELDRTSAANLPVGVDGGAYLFADLNGEGIAGILSEQAGGWFYKPNLGEGRFGPIQQVAPVPSLASLRNGQQLLDLAGDGQIDLVAFGGPAPGFYERTEEEGWDSFRPFRSLPNVEWQDPNLRFVDLDGDGRADVLLTADDVYTWYESLDEEGFGPPRQARPPRDDDRGARLIFADGTQSVHLADMSGDGLSDLVRVRNGEVCYWPNIGYGRFGAKVTMDDAPWFDHPEQFDQRRVRLADVDGSGATDIIYLGRHEVRVYFNRSGNRWSSARRLAAFPHVDDLSSVTTADLFGNGTACLVWSSALANDANQPLRYIDLMGGSKPHLLLRTFNNLGAETRVRYASSTKFYLQDKLAGRPWITRLSFPVQVVERVETFDRISRNRFVTRYAYHHGCYDGEEREFRGFAFVEQRDTEEFATLNENSDFPAAENIEASSHVPPVLTKTWFHTGSRVARDLSRDFYREPGLDDAGARALLLPDVLLPADLTDKEEREACRALKGTTLRTEIYALDGTEREPHPYSVAEQNRVVRLLQPRRGNRHAVFVTHARESVSYHYERALPPDPRVAHTLTLEVDDFGNVLKSAAISYGRRGEDATLPAQADRDRQSRILITYDDNRFTNAIDSAGDHRTPLPSESQTYELTGLTLPPGHARFTFAEIANAGETAEPLDYEETPGAGVQKRLLKHARMFYRRNDLAGPLALHALESLALRFETYRVAFTPGLLTQLYASRVDAAMLESEGRYVHTVDETDTLDANWWASGGRVFHSPDAGDSAAQELAYAREHFFLPCRLRDSFHTVAVSTERVVDYDGYDLLPIESRDAAGNRIAAENDYRVMQPRLMTGANGNRSAVAFDALGMVVGSAAMGKAAPAPAEGDSLAGFVTDLTDAAIAAHIADPLAGGAALLHGAGTRVLYDAFAYYRTRDAAEPQPAVVCTLVRETHLNDPVPEGGLRIQHTFTYSDGFAREIQKKLQAEPDEETSPRWIGSGWTVFNNKGSAVRAFEPFFTATHHFELEVEAGVSPITFYDPLQRVVATLHPDHTWEKVVFDPWRHETWDRSDTVLLDPATDPHVSGFFTRLRAEEVLPSWHAEREGGALGAREQEAARKAAVHAGTFTLAHSDSLGRGFLAIARNRFKYSNTAPADPPVEELYARRVTYDIEGKELEKFDANGRMAIRYAYDMLGNRLTGTSMEAGNRWTLNDVAGKPIREWDSLGRITRTEYDALRRPVRTFVAGIDAGDPEAEILADRLVYGEQHPDAELLNLRDSVYLHFDQAGVARNEERDYKNNLLSSSRRIAREHEQPVDWSAIEPFIPAASTATLDLAALETALGPLVEDEVYTNTTQYDALNRPTEQASPDGTVVRLGYNEANRLNSLRANLRGALQNGLPVWTPFVTDLDYDAKGQRTRIEYGNGAVTEYEYDALTYRLRRLHTSGNDGSLQDLLYTYDPAGNVTHIRDDAQQTIFFSNHRIDPSADYTYDALYRLIEATGREHLGQIGGTPIPHSNDDVPRVGVAWSDNDGDAMGAYLERYLYDPAGNILEMQHRGTDPVVPGWTRTYEYADPNNRLTSTTVGAHPTERYVHDGHGSMIRMPHFGGAHPDPNMRWDYRNQLHEIDLGGGGTVDYVYDSSGSRMRKMWRKSPGLTEERIYLGPFEVFRRRNGNGDVTFERETLHIVDDTRRIAIVETRTIDLAGNDPAPEQLIRYQFANHLGSAGLELDREGDIISYEEYSPYGSSTYQAVRSQTETPKRYRYSGVERDEESGLGYHGARYYAPWLGRWTATDPAGLVDGENLYRYARDNPVVFNDPAGKDPPSRTSRYSLGDFRLEFAHPVDDPLAHASYADLAIPGLLGLGFTALDLGTRVTENRIGRGFINFGEFAATFVLFYGPMVLSHEWAGHVGTAERYGLTGEITEFNWFTGAARWTGTPTAEQRLAITAGGVNQQQLNAATTYSRVARFGYFTPSDAIWMFLGVGGTTGYSYIALAQGATPDPINDIANYSRGPRSWSPGGIAAASTITALPAFAGLVYSAVMFIGFNQRSVEVPSIHFGESGRLTFPMMHTFLTSAGTILSATSVLSLGNDRPGFELGVDVRPTRDFALGVSATTYGLRIPRTPIEINPYARITAADPPGVYGGVEMGINAASWLTINARLEGGINDIRAEPEGLPLTPGQWGGGGGFDLTFRW